MDLEIAFTMHCLIPPAEAGGTGFQPVVSGLLPETRGARYARKRSKVRRLFARPKSGRMPHFTGWKPVPPETLEGGE